MVLCGPEVGKSWVNCQALMGQTSSGLRLMWVNYRGFMGGKSLIHGSNLGSVEGPPGHQLPITIKEVGQTSFKCPDKRGN